MAGMVFLYNFRSGERPSAHTQLYRSVFASQLFVEVVPPQTKLHVFSFCVHHPVRMDIEIVLGSRFESLMLLLPLVCAITTEHRLMRNRPLKLI